MKILLVNPNLYLHPPVPPLALEYRAGATASAGHECRILDLCFSPDPALELQREVQQYQPEVAGVTVRNIDLGLFQNNLFFLDEIRQRVACLEGLCVPVVLGGAGFSFHPRAVLDYLGARWGISGPAEQALPAFLDSLAKQAPPPGTVVDGWEWGIDPGREFSGRGETI